MFLTRIGVTIFVVCLLTTVAMVYYGHQQPEAASTTDLHWCGNRVCMLDLVLFKTGYNEARMSLLAKPNFTRLSAATEQIYKTSAPFYRIQLYGRENSDVITEVDLIFSPNRADLTTNALVAKFGSPCAVLPRYAAGTIVLIYPGMVIFSASASAALPTRLDPSSAVQQINLLDNRVQTCAQMQYGGSITRWRGFRNY